MGNDKTEKKSNLMQFLRQWLRKFVQNVPEEIAVCEFSCHKLECTQEEWEKCERRKQYLDCYSRK